MKVIRTEKIIKKCLDCDDCVDEQSLTGIARHYKDSSGKCHSYFLCAKKDNRLIIREDIIPLWCPLEDYKEEKCLIKKSIEESEY